MPDVTAPLVRNGVSIDATYAEAFDMRATALVITAPTLRWARIAATSMTGFATSVIACGVEAGIDAELSQETTPDGRPGVRVLLFAGSAGELQKQLINRVGQCVLTSPGSACYAGLAGTEPLKLGDGLRYFADGWQISKRLPDRHIWRLPVMDGEFVCEGTTGLTRNAVGGGNLIVMGRTSDATLAAAEAAADAIAAVPDAIAPFPGGIARSGSKVGSKYKGLMASTNHFYCPTLRGAVPDSALGPEIGAVLELVIDGLTPDAVAAAMRAGLAAVVALGPDGGACRVGAGNYGGKLGRHHFQLHDLAPEAVS
jgi:formylmethanofuran--tetrahydromethanopterin N-formyltransferase